MRRHGQTHVARFPSLDGDPRVGADPTMSVQAVVDDDGPHVDCLALADTWRVTPDEARALAVAIYRCLSDLAELS